MEYIAKNNGMNCAILEIWFCNGWQIIKESFYFFFFPLENKIKDNLF